MRTVCSRTARTWTNPCITTIVINASHTKRMGTGCEGGRFVEQLLYVEGHVLLCDTMTATWLLDDDSSKKGKSSNKRPKSSNQSINLTLLQSGQCNNSRSCDKDSFIPLLAFRPPSCAICDSSVAVVDIAKQDVAS
jgi:hypothetical protein